MKHTPGPWSVAVYTVTQSMVERMKVGSMHHAVCTNHVDNDPSELLVAICGDEPGANSQSAADAYLIASAPELFQSLKNLVSLINDGEDIGHAVQTATRVLAKAVGEL